MKHNNRYSKEFRDQALSKARERGEGKTLKDVANELNLTLSTLKGWIQFSNRSAKKYQTSPLSAVKPSQAWNANERLQALIESYNLQDEALHAWCREKGIYAHQLIAWRESFCTPMPPSIREERGTIRELQSQNDLLERQLRRKDKALAEAAALLVLQKKFQALWVDEV
jgi:transposase-like protein